jgi:succinyl-CoA synthetase beta subunit
VFQGYVASTGEEAY